SDLRGRKVRVVPDQPLTDFWRVAHTAPTPIPLSSLYDAFANGQVDAMHIDFENTLKQKFFAHAGSVLESNHMIFPMVAVASEKSWVSFSESDQALLLNIMSARLAELRDTYAALDPQFRDELQAEGVQINTTDESFFAEAAALWEQKWARLSPFISDLKAEAELLTGGSSI
ncbi:MAG: C4-dicarboxylate ABC transporter substrate-binding protein, partial [Ponticaulis sp.]|nr:C4-dicarboxylate ABC transporter substrate-binding protein [Ponticaulis sp.]